MRFLVLVNDEGVPPGRLADAAERYQHTLEIVDVAGGEPIPDPDGFDGVVSLGGAMGAYEVEAHPFLADEKKFLADAVWRGVPVLGLCLGSQLLADALGGRTYLAPTPELAFAPVECLDLDDATTAALASGPVVRFHRDTWDAPPGARVVATGGGFGQAFRYASALAVQSHPEVTQESFRQWVASPGSADILTRTGVDAERLVETVANAEAGMARVSDSFFSAWFAEVASAAPTV